MPYLTDLLQRIRNWLSSSLNGPLGHWSTWLSTVGTMALAFFFWLPQGALTLWNNLPPALTVNMKQQDGITISIALLLASIVSKFIPQAKVMAKLKAVVGWLTYMLKETSGAAARNAVLGAAAAGLLALVGPVVYERLHIDVPAHEGTIHKGYLDPAGIPTKCAGDTTNVVVGQVYTDEECRVSLDTQLLAHAAPVLKCSPQIKDRPYILAATIDLAYNIGPTAYCRSTVAARFKAGDFRGGCAAMSAWVYAGGKKLPGLIKRRADNRRLCERGL